MVRCPSCGTENLDMALFCEHCGAALRPVYPAYPMPLAQQPPAPQPAERTKTWIVVGIVITIVVVLGAVVGYLFFTQPMLEIVDAAAVMYDDGEVRFTVTVENTGRSTGSGTIKCEITWESTGASYSGERDITLAPGEMETYRISVWAPASYWYDDSGTWECWIED